MLMTKGLDLKILYTLLIAVSGIVLTIGAASALMVYAENLEVDNQTGDSSIKVTSSTGASQLILEDQGKRTWSVTTQDGKSKFQIWDETLNKPRLTIQKGGQVGIGIQNPQARLHVAGTFITNGDANVRSDLNVNGVITGPYIATLEATILDLQTRLAALEGTTVPMVTANEGMIATHDITISSNVADIANNSVMLAAHDAAIDALEEGNPPPPPSPCDTNGDGAINDQEMYDYRILIGDPRTFTVMDNFFAIANTESAVGTPIHNDMLDTSAEVTHWNLNKFIPLGLPTCPVPP